MLKMLSKKANSQLKQLNSGSAHGFTILNSTRELNNQIDSNFVKKPKTFNKKRRTS